jgi:8-oxo-dGTP pyrophosphatase MutT (NUDIX family)
VRATAPIIREVSAGGVAWRGAQGAEEVVLVEVGERRRWQLPKGLVDRGETPEAAALREIREEAGITGEVEAPLGQVEYWYVRSEQDRGKVRVHKRVVFFLVRATGGDVADHDHEVHAAAWFPIDEAAETLAFESEREVVRKAQATLAARG